MFRATLLRSAAAAAILGLWACNSSPPLASDDGIDAAPAARTISGRVAATPFDAWAYSLRVMTRNVYLGAPITPLLRASSASVIPGLVAQMWATVQATDFPARAALLAAEIEANRPAVVALQEVALYRIQSPGDYLRGNPQSATRVLYDFVELLTAELTARGLDYSVASTRPGSDVELPSASGDDLRLTDHDLVLVRGDIEVVAASHGTYAVNLTVPVGGSGGPPVTLSRGWAAVDVTIAGRTVRFVSTHLETQSAAPVQVAQGAELAALVDAAPMPVIVLGDFNSPADGSGTATYGSLMGSGLVDAWREARPRDDGYTCCHDDDLLNAAVEFNRRIDLVLCRAADMPVLSGARQAVVVGADPGQRTAAGLWPADHAGVALTLRLRAAPAWLASR